MIFLTLIQTVCFYHSPQAAAEAMLQRYASGCNGLLPDVLLVVRDGVSDSQFDAVLASEYRAVQQVLRGRHLHCN